MQRRCRPQGQIGGFRVARVQRDGDGAGDVGGVGEKCDGVDEVERRVAIGHFLLADCPGRIRLLDKLMSDALSVPGLSGDGDEISSGEEMAEAVVPLIVGRGARLLPSCVAAELQSALKQQHLRIADGIVQFIHDLPGNGGIRGQSETQVGGVQVGPDNDGSGKELVLLIRMLDISPAAGEERVVAGGEILEGEASVIAGG